MTNDTTTRVSELADELLEQSYGDRRKPRYGLNVEDYERLLEEYEPTEIMRALKKSCDTEVVHMHLDKVLLAMIDDEEAREEFENTGKWYA